MLTTSSDYLKCQGWYCLCAILWAKRRCLSGAWNQATVGWGNVECRVLLCPFSHTLLQIESLDCSPCKGLPCELVARNDSCIYVLDAVESRADSAHRSHRTFVLAPEGFAKLCPEKLAKDIILQELPQPIESLGFIDSIHVVADRKTLVCGLLLKWLSHSGTSISSCWLLEDAEVPKFLFVRLFAAGHGGCHGT